MELSKFEISGLLSQQKVVNAINSTEIRDMTNLYVSRVEFDVNAKNRNTGMMRMFKGADK